MSDKVIKGLECCTRGYGCASDCPYFKKVPMTDGICITMVQADALALLKEQDKEIKQLRTWKAVERGEVIRTYEDRNEAKLE